jgi:DNA mismatch repair protein MSH5
MLRDALGELHQGGGVEIISKLTQALDIASFRDVGAMVNETVCIMYSFLRMILRYNDAR